MLGFDKLSLMLVSHDREFLDGLANKVFEFKDGKVNEFLGGIKDYLEDRKARGFREIEASTKSAEVQKPKTETKVQLSREEQKEQNRIKNRIGKLEQEISELEERLSDLEKKFESKHTDEDSVKYAKTQKELELRMSEWEELMIKVG